MPSRWIYVAAAGAVIAGLVGVMIGFNLAPEDDASAVPEPELAPGVSNVGEVVSISQSFDGFDRVDDPTALGTAPGGPAWAATAGTWGILANQAYLADPIAGRNLAVVDVGESDGTLQARLMTMGGDGAGLVFRYQDVTNYWAFVAVPAYGTWAAVKVIDGREQAVANTGLSATAGDTTIGVRLDGSTIDLVLDSRVATTITDPELSDATLMGLTARDEGARFDDLRASQPAEAEEGEVDEGETEGEENIVPDVTQSTFGPPTPGPTGETTSSTEPVGGETTSSTEPTGEPPAVDGTAPLD